MYNCTYTQMYIVIRTTMDLLYTNDLFISIFRRGEDWHEMGLMPLQRGV